MVLAGFHIMWCSEERAREAIFYSYKRHINGFAANLEDEEAAEIASKKVI